MKKFSLVFIVLFVSVLSGFVPTTFAKRPPNSYQEPVGTTYQELSQSVQPDETAREMQKDKELLAIWKDHVRTLTKERDEAYKEIEALKNQGVSISPAAPVDPGLREVLDDLRAENQKLKLALKENKEAQADKEVILREKEEALGQFDYLKDKMTLLQKKQDQTQNENQKLQAWISSLRTQTEKLNGAETELQKTRESFASYMKESDARIKQAFEENNSLKSTNDALLSENKQVKKTQAQQSKIIQTLKSNIQSSLDSLNSNRDE